MYTGMQSDTEDVLFSKRGTVCTLALRANSEGLTMVASPPMGIGSVTAASSTCLFGMGRRAVRSKPSEAAP
jgi:hypothetical protein